jgi:hypothetical protein
MDAFLRGCRGPDPGLVERVYESNRATSAGRARYNRGELQRRVGDLAFPLSG